jgi:uncharacterized protein
LLRALAVTVFGATTAVSYAISGLVDWPLAALLALGGVAGGVLGAHTTKALASKTHLLRPVLAGFVTRVDCM